MEEAGDGGRHGVRRGFAPSLRIRGTEPLCSGFSSRVSLHLSCLSHPELVDVTAGVGVNSRGRSPARCGARARPAALGVGSGRDARSRSKADLAPTDLVAVAARAHDCARPGRCPCCCELHRVGIG
jgi:hypothetical protein